MKTKLIGLFAGFALIGAASASDPESTAQNRDDKGSVTRQETGEMHKSESSASTNSSSTYSPSSDKTTMGTSAADKSSAAERGLGGSSTAGTSSGSATASPSATGTLDTKHDMASTELIGKVVRADRGIVWVDHMGAVVPLKIESNTKFESAGVTKASDLKEGQEIRASFTVKDKTSNVASSIWLEGATSTGGSGSSMDRHNTVTSPNRPDTLPEGKGTESDTKNSRPSGGK